MPRRMLFVAMTLSVALSDSAAAQTVIRAARMLDLETGRMVRNPVVVVEGDRIATVGGRPPRGGTLIDLGDATLLPGLIDLHTHLLATNGAFSHSPKN